MGLKGGRELFDGLGVDSVVGGRGVGLGDTRGVVLVFVLAVQEARQVVLVVRSRR